MATGGLYGSSTSGAVVATSGVESSGLYGSSPTGALIAEPGAESSGLYGNTTSFGGTYFEWFIFQTSATQPATPTGGSWNFQTNVGTAPAGWTSAPAANPTNPVWISIAIVNSRSTTPLVWSTPGVLSYSGTINGAGAPTSGVGQIGELYIQTGVTPNALWFKTNSTTWTQITGSALFVDLTSNQTIAGVKTFSSTIQGSISGNAGTVTNGVYTDGSYVNPAWIASLAGSKITGDISGNAANVTGVVAVVNGGTGSTTSSGARTNLGLGTIATQDASSVAITGGSIAGITDLAIADGGTGASTAAQARINLGLGTAAVLDAGVANGVATLDAGGTVPLSQIPASIQGGVSYQGTWNATTNTPTLTSSVGTKGYYYVVSTAGSTDLNGVTSWNIGDWAIFNGTAWEKIDNTDAVTSVNGYTGTVVLTQPDIAGTVPTTRTITAGTGLTGGGDLSADRTFAIDSTVATLTGTQTLTNKTLTSPVINQILDANGNEILNLSPVASATDYFTVRNGIGVGVPLHLQADGPSTNIGLHIQPKGSGLVTISDGTDFNKGIRFRSSSSAAGAVTLIDAVSSSGHVITLPNANTTLVGRDTTDTLTNKTLTSPVVNTPSITGGNIDNTVIGNTTPNAATFTTLTATGQTDLGTGSAQFLRAVGGATAPTLSAQGSGTNVALNLASKGTGEIFLNSGTGFSLQILSQPTNVNFGRFTSTSTGTSPLLQVLGSDSNIDFRFRTQGTGAYQFDTGSNTNTQLRLAHTASAVNFVQVTGAATGGQVQITAQGSDATVPLTLNTKSTAPLRLQSNSFSVLRLNGSSAAANFFDITNANSGVAPTVQMSSTTDSNVPFVVRTLGTGAINLAPGSSGVNISNGGTVTAITRTAGGSGYTSAPSVAISAPTTAGGVQATASASIWLAGITSIANGGTGYSVNDVLTVSGGTFTTAATVTVLTTSGGVVTSVGVNTNGQYSVAPTNPASFTGGTGAGLTVNLLFNFAATGFTITNAGSGYVEQPTVTFSGGGGSGAAAYATVGSGTVIRSLGSNLDFFTPAGLSQLRVADSGSTTNDYVQISGGANPYVAAGGSSTNQNLFVSSRGTGSVFIRTNGVAQTQLVVAHTASAVNFVQVTGAATGGAPTISTQGSDTNASLILRSKGTFACEFQSSAGTILLQALPVASSVNYYRISPAVTGFGPVLSAQGSDANIPAVVQPKGTGALQAQLNDGTATGGNARGANAVDWQTSRNAAGQVASGTSSVLAGGLANTVSGAYAATLAGLGNVASGTAATALGGQNQTSSGSYSAALSGFGNSATGFFGIVAGGSLNSTTSNSAVTTQSATMNGTTAVTLSGSNAAIRVGQLIAGTFIAGSPFTYVAAISGTSLTLSQAASGSGTATISFFTPHGVVVGGGNNQATGAYSFIGGGGDAGTAANRNVASGDWSVVAGGSQNTASGNNSAVLGGGNCSATGSFAVNLGGAGNGASGFGATNLGGNGNNANATYALTGGFSATNRSISGFAFAEGSASRNGDAQIEFFVLRNSTTDATPTVLTIGAGAASTTNQVILPNNSAYSFRGTVIANVTGAGNTKSWAIEGAIKRGANAGSTVLVGTPTVTSAYADVGAATWTIAVTADTTNGGLAVTFTGQAATTIRTVAKLETTEVTF